MGKIARGVNKINLPCCMAIIAIFLYRISLKNSLRAGITQDVMDFRAYNARGSCPTRVENERNLSPQVMRDDDSDASSTIVLYPLYISLFLGTLEPLSSSHDTRTWVANKIGISPDRKRCLHALI